MLSEVFREIIELINLKCGSPLDLNGNVLEKRAFTYANPIQQAGAPLDKCVGFADCTNIRK